MPMEQSSWSLGTVAKTSVVASCQKRQPAGEAPEWVFTPAGTASAKAIPTGGCVSCKDSVSVAAIEESEFMSILYLAFAFPKGFEALPRVRGGAGDGIDVCP